jgi:hypothetical protein
MVPKLPAELCDASISLDDPRRWDAFKEGVRALEKWINGCLAATEKASRRARRQLHIFPNDKYTLVAERTPQFGSGAGIVGKHLSPAGMALVELGFPADWWLSPELARRWRCAHYPLSPSPESVAQWVELQRDMARVAMPFDQQRAEQDYADLDNDLALIRGSRPDLLPTAESGTPPKKRCKKPKQQARQRAKKKQPPGPRVVPRGQDEVQTACGLVLIPGGFSYGGKPYLLSGKPRAMLAALLVSRYRRCTAAELRKSLDLNDDVVTYPEQVVKDAAKELRAALRKAANDAGLSCDNPLKSVGKREELTYILAMP